LPEGIAPAAASVALGRALCARAPEALEIHLFVVGKFTTLSECISHDLLPKPGRGSTGKWEGNLLKRSWQS